jgi:N-methylhydantoinase A/oxoprolinase/acetone carboxylase beta subunit
MVEGGYNFDGRTIAPMDEAAVRKAAVEIKERGLTTAAITSVFSPVNPDMEQRTAEVLPEEVPDIAITLSHEIGRIGFLERENATVMNACLADLAKSVVGSFRDALASLSIEAPFYISQNDGTLMTADYVERYPVLTFASGPTNSMRGAVFLAGLRDAMVVDIGGTTTDVGMLVKGFPRESSVAVEIGGVRTNFRMPDVLNIGLGGGSIVRDNGSRIGPDSVGYRLTEEALIFGGETLTTTDIVVAAGLVDIGDRKRVADLDSRLVDTALDNIHEMVDTAVDRMRTSAEPLPIILVGGGSILISREIPSALEIKKPDYAPVANAIGAAIAQVGGEVERMFSLDAISREAALEQAKSEAIGKAVDAGARPETVDIVDIEEVMISYLPGNATRIRVKAAGDLAMQ